MEKCVPEGVEGAIANFVCFHCPLVASADAKSPATIKIKKQKCASEAVQRAIGKPSGRVRRREIPCVEAQNHTEKREIAPHETIPLKKTYYLHRFLEFRNALFDLLRLLLIQRQFALLLLHQRGGRLAHKARIV